MRQMGNATVLSGLEEIVGISSGQAYSSLRVALFNLRPSGEEWQRRIPRSITRAVSLLALALVLLCLCGCCWSNILLLSFFCPSCCLCDVRRARPLILDRSSDTPSQLNAASRLDDAACYTAFKIQHTLFLHFLPQHCTTPPQAPGVRVQIPHIFTRTLHPVIRKTSAPKANTRPQRIRRTLIREATGTPLQCVRYGLDDCGGSQMIQRSGSVIRDFAGSGKRELRGRFEALCVATHNWILW
jgi:hypothetical protein